MIVNQVFMSLLKTSTLLKKLMKIQSGFGKEDILRVKLRREKFYTEETKKLKTEHYIEKAIRYKDPPRQSLLNIEN